MLKTATAILAAIGHHVNTDLTACKCSKQRPLHIVLIVLLPAQAELDKWIALDDRKQRTLPGLMALLQADERPEADQPEVLKGFAPSFITCLCP